MTERLRDLVDADDPAVAELAQLVRAASDLDPRPGAQERVGRRLSETPPHRRRSLRQPVLVLLVLMAVMSVVIAGVRLIIPRFQTAAPDQPAAGADQRPVIGPPSPLRAIPPRPVVPPPADERVEIPAVPSLADAHVETPSAERPRVASPTGRPHPDPVPQPTPGPATIQIEAPGATRRATASAEPAPPALDAPIHDRLTTTRPSGQSPVPSAEATLVLRALNALRRDHDARAALRELYAYSTRFPDGDLAEEALALSIEARAALDDAAARGLAEQYLQRFPHGRFRALAERAKRRFDHR